MTSFFVVAVYTFCMLMLLSHVRICWAWYNIKRRCTVHVL